MTTEQKLAKAKAKVKKLEALLKTKQYIYPIYKQSITNGQVVKFDGLISGEVVVKGNLSTNYDIRHRLFSWIEHTCTGTWKDFDPADLNKPNDKDLVYCWDDDMTHCRAIRFYDAVANKTFSTEGNRCAFIYDNYEVIPRNQWPEWAIEAYKTLED